MKTYWMSSWTRYISLVILPILFYGCIVAKKSLPTGAAVVKPTGDLKEYLNSFEDAVKSHDKALIIKMLDPTYVEEQHDKFLEGRTDQFLSEFFDAKLESIKKIRFITTYKWRDILWVKYFVILKGDKHTVSWSIQKQDAGLHYKYGLVGAVG